MHAINHQNFNLTFIFCFVRFVLFCKNIVLIRSSSFAFSCGRSAKSDLKGESYVMVRCDREGFCRISVIPRDIIKLFVTNHCIPFETVVFMSAVWKKSCGRDVTSAVEWRSSRMTWIMRMFCVTCICCRGELNKSDCGEESFLLYFIRKDGGRGMYSGK